MLDRPALDELIAAVRGQLEAHVIPALKAGADTRLYFQTLVAANLLGIVERELHASARHLAEAWREWGAFEGVTDPLPADPTIARRQIADREAALCSAIRAGDLDDHPALLDLLIARTTRALEVANPRLLMTLIAELNAPSAAHEGGA